MAKVGDLEGQEQEEVKKGRQPYDSAALVKGNAEAVDADGLLTVVPSDFNTRKNNPLKKDAFASEAVYIQYQSLVATQRSEFYAARAAELASKAERLLKFGSEEARKAATKLARAKATMATLRQQLIDTGMSEQEIDDLIANM